MASRSSCKLRSIKTNATILLATWLSGAAIGAEVPDPGALERDGAVIGEIRFERANIFDLSDPREDRWLFRWANRLHVVTREKVIKKQLLFESGETFNARDIEESARILRGKQYLFDAAIEPVAYEDGVVDLAVKTRDVWTLMPDFSVSRSGGENRSKLGIQESNLLGRGQFLSLSRSENVDRTQKSFEFADPHIGRSWVAASLKIADNSDGKLHRVTAVRPFHALDARWSAGAAWLDNDLRSTLYVLGNEAAEYRQQRDYWAAFAGWSGGMDNGRVRRWTAGFVRDRNRFAPVAGGTLPAVIPADRDLAYPYIGIEVLEDEFETSRNRDQIGRTEDFYLGTRLGARLGWSDEAFGADRDALVYGASFGRGFGSLRKKALLLGVTLDGRLESGHVKNALLKASARYYRTQSEKRVFFATMSATAGQALDLDNPVQIGGDSGLRGYPLRYQSGDSKVLLTLEQRYITDWYPFRLARIGAAVFADVGRVWGDDPLAGRRFGWLADVGFGLRLAPTRSSGDKMVHFDVAFPLGGDDSIDSVQFLVESKRSF